MPSGIAGTVGLAERPAAGAMLAFAKRRGLSVPTLERMGVVSATAFFPDLGRQETAMVFCYAVGWKARTVGDEKSFVASKGFELSFWNLANVLNGDAETVYLVEGEIDALSLVEAGIATDAVLSVPNGAREPKKRPNESEPPHQQRGYAYVLDALKAGLSQRKRFVWCGDGDGPGRALRHDMAQMLGAARFWFVDWPDGCNDANDMLRTDGARDLRDLVSNGALPWPVRGLFRLSQLPDPPPMTLWLPGFPEWEHKVMLSPRTLSVATGHPGHGKTKLLGQIWYQVASQYDVPIFVASFETRPKPHMRRSLRSLHSGRLEVTMTPGEIAKADAWIDEHYLFAVHPDRRPTLEWFLDTAEVAVVRHGARVVQLDPWNRLEASRQRDESETDYILRCLRSMYVFAEDLNCHVQVVAHPSKLDAARRGKPPDLEDISGSKHWDNVVDQGFVVHRPEMFKDGERKTGAVFYHKKARHEELGYPCQLHLNFDLSKDRYVSVDYR